MISSEKENPIVFKSRDCSHTNVVEKLFIVQKNNKVNFRITFLCSSHLPFTATLVSMRIGTTKNNILYQSVPTPSIPVLHAAYKIFYLLETDRQV